APGFVRTPMTDRNTFPMPFLISPEEAARAIADGMAKDKAEIVFPLPMMLTMKLARLVPVRAWTAATAAMTRRGMSRDRRQARDRPRTSPWADVLRRMAVAP